MLTLFFVSVIVLRLYILHSVLCSSEICVYWQLMFFFVYKYECGYYFDSRQSAEALIRIAWCIFWARKSFSLWLAIYSFLTSIRNMLFSFWRLQSIIQFLIVVIAHWHAVKAYEYSLTTSSRACKCSADTSMRGRFFFVENNE